MEIMENKIETQIKALKDQNKKELDAFKNDIQKKDEQKEQKLA